MTQLLDEKAAAQFLGVKPGTLAVWRARRSYPLSYIKVGTLVRYDADALEKFLRSRTVTPGKKKARRRKRSAR